MYIIIEYVLKKAYNCSLGTLHEGGEIRVMTYNGQPVVFYDGGMCDGSYGDVLLNLINDKKLHNEYLIDREVIKNKV